jgi:hypothetical protein
MHGRAEDGWVPTLIKVPTMNERIRAVASMGLFVVLAGFVAFSGIRLALLLWQRFAVG